MQTVFYDYSLYLLLIEIMELFRRMIWAIIRVESENVNNLYKFRPSLEIPHVRNEELEFAEDYI